MITDFGNVKIGAKVFEDVPIERDWFDRPIKRETKICEVTRLVPSGKASVWVTFRTPEGYSYATLKRITTKCMEVA